MATKKLLCLPTEWCAHLSQLCQQFDDENPSPPAKVSAGNCSSNSVPLMYLMPPVILWSPLEQFPVFKGKLNCPKCPSSGGTLLHASGWRDGSKGRRSEPRKIYGEDGIVLLVGRVYTCTKGHEVVGYHPSILRNIPTCFIPFNLWHITGFTKQVTQLIASLITSGLSIHGISKIIFQKQAFWYCNQRSKFVEFCKESTGNFPSLTEWQPKISSALPTPHAVSGCFLEDFWEKESLYKRCMQMTSVNADDAWLSCDHTFASASKFLKQVISFKLCSRINEVVQKGVLCL